MTDTQTLPLATQREIDTPEGRALGISHRWVGGQYCALLTRSGLVGCGIYDLACANEFDFAFALAKGTPDNPLIEPEDLLPAKIVLVSERAKRLGIHVGMTGQDALARLLESEQHDISSPNR